MKICSNPLDTVRSTGSNQQWCIPLPTCYSTIIPYVPTNVEYNGQQTSNTTTAFCSDINNYNGMNIIDSSLCAESQLIQRIRQKIDLYQTPSSNDAHQILQYLTDTVKKHVPDFVFKETTDSNIREQIKPKSSQLESNIQQDVVSTSSSKKSKSRSPSFLQRITNRKFTNKRSLSKDSSFHSTNLSVDSNRMVKGSSQFSPTRNVQFSSKLNENDFENVDNNELQHAIHNKITNSSDQDKSTMNFSTPNISIHHPGNDHITSAINLKSNQYLSPSYRSHRTDKRSSRKQTTSTIQSPTNSTIDIEQQKLHTQSLTPNSLRRSPSDNSQYNSQVQHTSIEKMGKRNNWLEK
ncbi:unnamed protein product [Rotaria sordida]|uniref:Uncharacterized protein n=1 Tax=Rotaria sordida TaxID=392033 RepID=A0A814FWZ9_9BILA|nr:unnamed protein product [Rotaria sordida]CAF1060805.1 unnamed protein product [Rotaria sordida]